MAGRFRNILPAISQGGELGGKHVEPVVQILTKAPGVDHRFEISIGSGDNPNFYLYLGRTADTGEISLFAAYSAISDAVEAMRLGAGGTVDLKHHATVEQASRQTSIGKFIRDVFAITVLHT